MLPLKTCSFMLYIDMPNIKLLSAIVQKAWQMLKVDANKQTNQQTQCSHSRTTVRDSRNELKIHVHIFMGAVLCTCSARKEKNKIKQKKGKIKSLIIFATKSPWKNRRSTVLYCTLVHRDRLGVERNTWNQFHLTSVHSARFGFYRACVKCKQISTCQNRCSKLWSESVAPDTTVFLHGLVWPKFFIALLYKALVWHKAK